LGDKISRVMRCLICLDFCHNGGWKIKIEDCFDLKTYFPTYFLPKISRKHYKHFDKFIYGLKKVQNSKSIWNKKFLTFKIRKTLKLNFPYQMKSFDTKINRFGGRNICQQHFSLSLYSRNQAIFLSFLSQTMD
jgi:hypothetical protein